MKILNFLTGLKVSIKKLPQAIKAVVKHTSKKEKLEILYNAYEDYNNELVFQRKQLIALMETIQIKKIDIRNEIEKL